jgi:hypothetical protein
LENCRGFFKKPTSLELQIYYFDFIELEKDIQILIKTPIVDTNYYKNYKKRLCTIENSIKVFIEENYNTN